MRLCCCRPWKRRKSRAGRPPLHTFHPWIGDREKLSRFDLNCATLISVFRVVVVSAANLYPRARFKIRNSNGNTISRGSYKEKSNNFSQTRYRARARYGQRDFSIVYDNTTRFHILLRPISLFSPLSNGRNVACNDVTLLPAALIGRQPRGAEPSLHAIPTATRSSLSFASPTFRPARTGIFWRVDTETRLETCCMCFHSSLTYIAGPCMEDVHASIGTHSREVNSAKSAIPGKRLAKADILAIGHDIVYRYTRCRDHVGGPRIYNLPTFPRLVSRLILTLLTYSRSSPPPLAPCAPR